MDVFQPFKVAKSKFFNNNNNNNNNVLLMTEQDDDGTVPLFLDDMAARHKTVIHANVSMD